ncbi:MAG: ribonuclease Z [Candidatus Pacearchaeota archaeon]
MDLIFLGTSAGVPTSERGHSAILLIYSGQYLLFDCGEGTQRQFVKAGISPLRLDKIFISHLHADHILGLSGLLQTLAMKDYAKELEVYGPVGINAYIESIKNFFPIVETLKLKINEIKKESCFDFKEYSIEALPLNHVTPTYGYAFKERDKIKIKPYYVRLLGGPSPLFKLLKEGKTIEHKGKKIKPKDATISIPGKKIAIVLDTRLCQNAIQLAKNADILIIECVYSKTISALAREYGHLTTSDVKEIIKKAKPKKIFLTHFSERYEGKESELLREIGLKNVNLARDFLKISLS